MGPFVILPRAFPLHLFLCPLGGRGRGYRSVMEVDCGTRKSRRRGRRGWGASLRAMVVVMVAVNGRQRTVVVGPEPAQRRGGKAQRPGRSWLEACSRSSLCTRTVFVLVSRGQKRMWLLVVVLGDVAPVTWLRRAVTHCDHACTNIQCPNSHKSSAIQIAARCWQQRQLPSRRRHRSPATSPIHVGYAPQPTHTPPTDLIKSLNPSTSHKKDGCSPSLLPCTSSLRSATTFRLCASPPLHLIPSSHIFISYLLFLLLFAYCHLHYSTSSIVKCVRSKTCAQTFRESLIWALT